MIDPIIAKAQDAVSPHDNREICFTTKDVQGFGFETCAISNLSTKLETQKTCDIIHPNS